MTYYKQVELEEGELVQFVGTYVTRWNYSAGPPQVGFVEVDWEEQRLLDAAEDMLEVCKAFVEAWEKSYQLEKTDVAVRMAKEVIARIEGE